MSSYTAAYLGFDLSSQGLKCIAVDPQLRPLHEEAINFDTDLPHYETKGGVIKNDEKREVFAPVAMWIEALDLVLTRMKEKGFDFSKVKGISGAGQQHASVFWSESAPEILKSLDPEVPLVSQLSPKAFTHPFSPNWQDHSTGAECRSITAHLSSPQAVADETGSKAHHRFTGPQILKFLTHHPDTYAATSRISLASSFLCSLLLGAIAPLDISDVCGMNLWNISAGTWSSALLSHISHGDATTLHRKLGDPCRTPGTSLGRISPYFTHKFNLNPSAHVYPFTGDNPATILSLPLRQSDLILSLGTSTTLLLVTPQYLPNPEYHLFNHPATPGQYMFMLCYCNGALARELIRDTLNETLRGRPRDLWAAFSQHAARAPDFRKLGVYFPLSEIIPPVAPGTWRFVREHNTVRPAREGEWAVPYDDARAILESQALSMRLRSAPLLATSPAARPRRLYVVGGGSRNAAIVAAMADVLGPREGVFQLEIGGNACALGAAYYAVWAGERAEGEAFEDFIEKRWDEEKFVRKVEGAGYREGVWEGYGGMMEAYKEVERMVVEQAGEQEE